MQRRQAYRDELTLDGAQQRAMRRFAGAWRFVLDKALAMQNENHAPGNTDIADVGAAKHSTTCRDRRETP